MVDNGVAVKILEWAPGSGVAQMPGVFEMDAEAGGGWLGVQGKNSVFLG